MAKLHLAQQILDIIWPVGSIYLSDNATNPNTKFGGTWVKLSGGFIYGSTLTSGNTYSTGNGNGTSTGSTTLSASQIPKFAFRTGHIEYGDNAFNGITNVTHTFDTSTGLGSLGYEATKGSGEPRSHKYEFGGGQGHSHNIPYIACSIWRRTA